MGGDHESYDKKVSTRPEYKSNKKSVLKNTYPFGQKDRKSAEIDQWTVEAKDRDSFFLKFYLVPNSCQREIGPYYYY